jgi:hypothetical protein
MSPQPWLRMHAFAVCVALIATVVLGGEVVVLAAGGLLALFGFWMWRKYQGDVLLAKTEVPKHRDRLDLLVAGDARAALLAPLVLAIFAAVRSPTVPRTPTYVLDAVATIAVVLVVVYGSSLFDWYVTLPRMTGLLGPRPCRRDERFKTFPKTWREVTRWWYFHRMVAGFVLVYGVALALGMVAAGVTGASSPWVDLSFTAVFGTLGAYQKAILPAAKEFMHPRLIVGDTVANRFRERRYVYDVALEGVQVVPPEKYEERAKAMGPDDRPDFEDKPERVPLTAVDEFKDAERYTGCDRCCAGISWYCIENEDCFKPK